jgi:hypothetical protein
MKEMCNYESRAQKPDYDRRDDEHLPAASRSEPPRLERVRFRGDVSPHRFDIHERVIGSNVVPVRGSLGGS